MKYTIRPNNDKPITFNSDNDFMDILRVKIGNEAVDWYLERITELEDYLYDIEEAMKDCKKSKTRELVMDIIEKFRGKNKQ